LIVGAYFADPSHKSSAGKSYVVFGKANSGAINLSAIADARSPCWVVCISNITQISKFWWILQNFNDLHMYK
jgi:hypothetical protein